MRVELQSFSLSYDGHAFAVRDLDLCIPSGSIFALIGPNGAGKSTSLQAIAGLMLPSAGRVLLDGAQSGDDDFAQRRREIGFVGESLPFERGVQSEEHLYFYARAHGLSRAQARARVQEVLVMLDLQDKARVPCRDLSKGMRQRLSLGRAWIHKPALLILDEPADGLDPRGRADLRKILRKIHQEQGTTILISSHILSELDELCDEVAILQSGKLAIRGKVQEIQAAYAAQSNRYRLHALVPDGGTVAQAMAQLMPLLVERGAVVEQSQSSQASFTLDLCLRGGDEASAALIASSVAAGVQIASLQRLGSRLEDVYEQLADAKVN